ncbi:retrovirus-related pol polyprotein LINE-1 [Tanacetum coccineum]
MVLGDGSKTKMEEALSTKTQLGEDGRKVKEALRKMGRNKAVGPDEIPIEAWRCLGGEEVRWLTILFNKTLSRAKMPEEWRLSEERVIKRMVRRETEVSKNQFGFMSGQSSMEVIHIIITLMEKYRERQKDLHLEFLDLEKAYDSVQRELIWKTLRDKGTPMKYIKVIQDIHTRWLNGRLEQLREMLENKGLRVSREKTEYMRCDFNRNENDQNGEAVAEMRMLRWTCGKTLLDMIPNGAFRKNLQVATIINKMREGRLRWFAHVKRRPQSAPVRRVETIVVDGVRRRGRPKLRWEYTLKTDLKELMLSEDMTSDRNSWRTRIMVDEVDA